MRPSPPSLSARRRVRPPNRVPEGEPRRLVPARRTVDPLDLLAEQARTRVPELIPIRYGRMAASPFAYFRGAALPMAADLAGIGADRSPRPAVR